MVLSKQNIVRALEEASGDLYCPCSTVAASVGRVSGLVYSLTMVLTSGLNLNVSF